MKCLGENLFFNFRFPALDSILPTLCVAFTVASLSMPSNDRCFHNTGHSNNVGASALMTPSK